MSKCAQCGAPVEPPLTVCANCVPATAIQENAPSPTAPEVPPEPPRSRKEIIRERVIAGAKIGAIWGAIYGVAFAFMAWSLILIFTTPGPDAWLTDFLPALLRSMVVGSLITAVVGAILKQFPRKKRG